MKASLIMKASSMALNLVFFSASMLAFIASARAAANVGAAMGSCEAASQCAMGALNERYDPKNPGMGPKFIVDKAKCQKLADQCRKDMYSKEPR